MSLQQTYLAEIAEAIRTKSGTTEEICAAQFAQCILEIPTGGGSGDSDDSGESGIPIKPVVGTTAAVISKPRPYSECGAQDVIVNGATVTELGNGSLRIGG